MKALITKTIILDCCWVCSSGIRFNEHHVIPRAFGGENGPQVTLCSDHHELIHAIANEIYPNDNPLDALSEHPIEYLGKLSFLVRAINNARRAIDADPRNKKVTFSTVFNHEEHKMLKQLVKTYRSQGLTSQDKVVKWALKKFYYSTFKRE